MAMKYEKYMYLYPPRPDTKITSDTLEQYDNGDYLAQPKYNGSCCNIFLDGQGFVKVMNRHKEEKTKVKFDKVDFNGMHRGEGWMVICGELLDKNKRGEDGKPFNEKFIIWDLLVYNGKYLQGSTLEDRLNFLELLYPCQRATVNASGELESYDHICTTGIKGVYKSPTYTNNFTGLFQELIKVDLYEGLVVKKRKGTLQWGFNERNNHDWQFKCRRPEKNYHL